MENREDIIMALALLGYVLVERAIISYRHPDRRYPRIQVLNKPTIQGEYLWLNSAGTFISFNDFTSLLSVYEQQNINQRTVANANGSSGMDMFS